MRTICVASARNCTPALYSSSPSRSCDSMPCVRLPDKLDEEIEAISAALKDCMAQIREVSTGLEPSDLRALSLAKVISTAICLHEARTATTVSCEFRDLPQDAPYALKSCLYQFIEQALGNIFRHSAASAKVHVRAKYEVREARH